MTNKSNDKQVFTTGEAAKICSVSQQTIIRCFDSGRLQGFKVPGSRFRRIPRAELVRFMQQNNMDMAELGPSVLQVLVIGLSAAETDLIIQTHASGHNVKIHHANDAWEAGFKAKECSPELILLSTAVQGVQKNSIQSTLVTQSGIEPMIVIVEKSNTNINAPAQNIGQQEIIKQAVLELLSA